MNNMFTYLILIWVVLQYTECSFCLCPAAVSWSWDRPLSKWIFFAASSEEKTEAATPHRRKEARKKGQVAKSSDLNSAVVVMAIIVVTYGMRDYLGINISNFVQDILSHGMTGNLDSNQFFNLYKNSLYLCLKVMAPIFVVGMVFGLLSNFLQVGFVLSSEAIKPKLSNINPAEGFTRMFSKRALVEFLKTLFKVTIIGFIVYNLVKNRLSSILVLQNVALTSTINYLQKTLYQISLTAVGAFLTIAVLDLVYQKWQFNQNIKMSKDEVKKEMKQNEGDPHIKARIREKQRMIAMRRMMQKVPEATVVVTNPTHLAIALKYDEKTMQAPQVIAKGADIMAQKIREKASEHNIPIVEDKPVARALYKGAEVGDFIPAELYQAVAGILAAIFSMKKVRRA